MDVTEETRNPKISQATYVRTEVSPTGLAIFKGLLIQIRSKAVKGLLSTDFICNSTLNQFFPTCLNFFVCS